MDTSARVSMSAHFKQCKAAACKQPTASCAEPRISEATALAAMAMPTSGDASSAGLHLTSALTALKVSLKRDLRSLIPPTPAASPVHSRSSKRARFDFDFDLDLASTTATDSATDKTSSKPHRSSAAAAAASSSTTLVAIVPAAEIETTTALFSISKQLQHELARKARSRASSSDHAMRARKRRSQLSYFAIAGAFHRAALERERSAQAVE